MRLVNSNNIKINQEASTEILVMREILNLKLDRQGQIFKTQVMNFKAKEIRNLIKEAIAITDLLALIEAEVVIMAP